MPRTPRTPDSPSPLRPWLPGPRRQLARTRILTLHEQRFDCPDHPQRSGDFTVIETNDWVNVLALTDPATNAGEVHAVLVEQFRYGTAKNTIEIPGGIIDPGEDPVAAGVRELLEETGFAGASPRVIGVVDANPAIMTNRATTVLVEHCRPVASQTLDEHEHIRVLTRPLEHLPAMVARGEITNAVVVAALFHHFAPRA